MKPDRATPGGRRRRRGGQASRDACARPLSRSGGGDAASTTNQIGQRSPIRGCALCLRRARAASWAWLACTAFGGWAWILFFWPTGSKTAGSPVIASGPHISGTFCFCRCQGIFFLFQEIQSYSKYIIFWRNLNYLVCPVIREHIKFKYMLCNFDQQINM